MVAGLLENPAELVVDDDGTYGGFAKIARVLSLTQPRGKDFSRQLVHKWYINREHNSFPEAHLVRTSTGRVKQMFVMADVEEWHRSYRRHHNTAARTSEIDTIPLFEIGSDGKTIW